MDDNMESGKYSGEDKDDNLTTRMSTRAEEEEEKEPNPTQVQNVDLKAENNIDGKGLGEFPIENPGPVDSASSTLKATNDDDMAANEIVNGNAGTDVSDVIHSNQLEPASPPKESMDMELDVQKKQEDIEETDGSHLNPSNRLVPNPSRERSVEMEAKDDEKGHELNVGMSNMELSPNREIKEQVSKSKLNEGNEVPMKGSEQSFLSALDEGDDSGTEEEQTTFMTAVENFYKERSLEFKPPKFYQKELNLLKLWRAVIKLGGYEQVTSCKLWRQVGQSFNPPKTCTTVSWTFRIFYEKALLEYEKHRMGGGELTESTIVNNQVGASQALGSGRTLRDAAARAIQGWHSRRLFGHGETGNPIVKEKNLSSMPKGDKQLKSIGFLKRKKPSSVERNVQVAHFKVTKPHLETMVVDVGPPADWVKINVQRFNDCFEVYALVPGLLREEVHVQSDPAGCLVISGQPAQLDNPWGVTPFKKVVSFPSRIDPHQTSAVVTLHGQLFVRVPFERSDL
ncbi:AT-rich interactive domain-containing protein 6-like [Juglans microcarpa x Juglans regia]|uniref:AT-rich interactive domain-containing protein 6-like n=1 Tax=Juglans microcarpa x Juglans regia TaxID=2249226 RepID=UPI001B7EBDB6|nr:AT-rich interactive domain-containing protein 6-like [Juglans microcarpa x Juglans regia]